MERDTYERVENRVDREPSYDRAETNMNEGQSPIRSTTNSVAPPSMVQQPRHVVGPPSTPQPRHLVMGIPYLAPHIVAPVSHAHTVGAAPRAGGATTNDQGASDYERGGAHPWQQQVTTGGKPYWFNPRTGVTTSEDPTLPQPKPLLSSVPAEGSSEAFPLPLLC